MAGNVPWSVKGIDADTRETAKMAARRAGMTVGQWISRTIRAAAAEQLNGEALAANGGADPANGAQSGGSGAGRPAAPTAQALFETLRKLTDRLEKAEMLTAATIVPLTEQIESLARRVDESRSETAVSTAPVERAVTKLTERLERIEDVVRPDRRERRWRLFGD